MGPGYGASKHRSYRRLGSHVIVVEISGSLILEPMTAPLPTANPLLDFSGLPHFRDFNVAHIEPGLDLLLSQNREQLETIVAREGRRDWDNFVQPIEDLGENIGRFWAPVSHINAVMDNPELRTAYEACLPKLSAYYSEIAQDERLYRGYKEVSEHPAFAALDCAQRKIIDNALRDARLGGVELDGPAKQRFKEIEQALSSLTNQFEQNVLDATQGWHLHITDEKQLAGLPATVIEVARSTAEHDGKPGWVFTLDAPSYIPFITYSESPELRREVYEAYVTRSSDKGPNAGRWDNTPLIAEILRLRQEAGTLLDFPHFAAYSLATKMADSVEQVLSFLDDLTSRSKPSAQAELDELREFACKQFGATDAPVWDLPYYSEKLRQSRFAFSEEDLRPYFPAPKVLTGMFEVVHRLFGLRIKPVTGIEVWHPDVQVYEVVDRAGVTRGQFYVDLYARLHKRGGAWMADCIGRKRTAAGVQTPVAFLTCNFSPPTGSKPSLLTHDEVTTLFHEFGHGLHHMLSLVDYVGVSGINGVSWDAVELPSQFLENWCWEREALDIISGHFESGAPLPDKFLNAMRAARNFQAAMQMLRQIEFSVFDLQLHSQAEPEQSVQQVLDAVRAAVAVVRPPEFNRFQNSFTHVFSGGYAAGYYSYKWAEVLAADAYSKFRENGVFDQSTGTEFMHSILERGGAEDTAALFREFRGREPKIDALLEQHGLLP